MGVYDCGKCKAMHISRDISRTQLIIRKMENGVAVQTTAKPLSLVERKTNIQAALVKHELELQGLCKDVPDEKLVAVIADFKKKWKTMQDSRKEFTAYVTELLISPFIAIENRVNPETYQPYKELVSRELKVRQDKVAEANKAALKTKEKADYQEHVRNEFHRVFNERKIKMLYEIGVAIKSNIPVSSPELLEVFNDVINAPKVYTKMETKYLEPVEKLAIAKTIPAPNYPQLVADMLKEAQRLEAEAAPSPTDGSSALVDPVEDNLDALISAAVNTAADEHTEERVQNNLIANQVADIKAPRIVKKRSIVVVNSKEWAEAIISAFYQYDVAWLMLKNRNFDKVTIGNMAEALSKCADITVEGVTYKEEDK